MCRALLNTDAELIALLDEFHMSKPSDFHRGVKNHVEHWEEVVNNNGEYIIH